MISTILLVLMLISVLWLLVGITIPFFRHGVTLNLEKVAFTSVVVLILGVTTYITHSFGW